MSIRSRAEEISSGEWMGEAEGEEAEHSREWHPDADGFQPPLPNPACGCPQGMVSAIGAREDFSLLDILQTLKCRVLY
jgi:hypothetical protein